MNRRSGDTVFEPPASQQLAELVDLACASMEGGHAHPAVGAAWIHVALAAIHPFRDGNGRTSRVAASLAMYRGGFRLPEFTSLEEWWGRHLEDYYASFDSLGTTFDPNRDVTSFLRSHIEAQVHQVRALDLRERVQRQLWLALEQTILDAGLDARVTNAVWDGFFGRDVTPRYYRPLADVSVATATNDLAGAVAAGLLRPQGNGRSRRYRSGPRLYAATARALGLGDRGLPDAEVERSWIVGELTKRVSDTR